MANGIEDLEEKNKGRAKPKVDARYVSWMEKLGKEDSEMLMEKSSRWSAVKESRGEYSLVVIILFSCDQEVEGEEERQDFCRYYTEPYAIYSQKVGKHQYRYHLKEKCP